MNKADAKESAAICRRVLTYLLQITDTRGRVGADMRTAVGDFLADAERLIQLDVAGPQLDLIFEAARAADTSLAQFASMRDQVLLEKPVSLGATLMRDCLIYFSLTTEARVLATTKFTSRNDVDAMKLVMNDGFKPMEEIAADSMDQMTFQGLVRLHAAVMFYLTQTSRPLPQMVRFAFVNVSPTLVLSHRLYADAGRADELRVENKVVHPAFAPRTGVALSSP